MLLGGRDNYRPFHSVKSLRWVPLAAFPSGQRGDGIRSSREFSCPSLPTWHPAPEPRSRLCNRLITPDLIACCPEGVIFAWLFLDRVFWSLLWGNMERLTRLLWFLSASTCHSDHSFSLLSLVFWYYIYYSLKPSTTHLGTELQKTQVKYNEYIFKKVKGPLAYTC